MRIAIPDDVSFNVSKKELFVLVHPFMGIDKAGQPKPSYGLRYEGIDIVKEPSHVQFIILPYSINRYLESDKEQYLARIDRQCERYGSQALAFISGDSGRAFPEFTNITYFRPGGFRSQLSERNQGIPIALSDQLRRLYGTEDIRLREKLVKPIIGFCGHASTSWRKKLKEEIKFMMENGKRVFGNPFRKDWEPLFPSAYRRAQLMNSLSQCRELVVNFIYRDQYRAGARTDEELERTTREYYDNIRNSDYVLCVRGGGNFSVRLYETLMMGRIPVFVNTDCLMPFPELIPWREHVVWVEWQDRRKIAEIVLRFHNSLNQQNFTALQEKNRKLWKEQLSVEGMLQLLSHQDNRSEEISITIT